jgi:hypothetical protein
MQRGLMEDPQVIKEIDRLIDSYNWSAVERDKPERVIQRLHQAIRSERSAYLDVSDSFYYIVNDGYGDPRSITPLMTEFLLKLIAHPRLRHKEWMLHIFAFYIHPHSRLNPRWASHVYRMWYEALPVFHQLLNHHRSVYRGLAVRILVQLTRHADMIVPWLLQLLDKEASDHVILVILRSLEPLIRLGRYRNYKHIILSTAHRQAILPYARRFIRAQNVCLRAAGITLVLQLSGKAALLEVVPDILECVHLPPRALRSPDEYSLYDRTMDDLITTINALRHPAGPDLFITMLSQAVLPELAKALWDDQKYDYGFGHPIMRSYIAINLRQKAFLEAVVNSTIWRTKGRYWADEYGLASTRRGVQQQLRHARIIEGDQFVYQQEHSDLPLKLNLDLLKGW